MIWIRKLALPLLVFALTGFFLWRCETVPWNVAGFIAWNMLLIAWVCIWPRGVTVSTLDSESSDRGSNPREAFYDQMKQASFFKLEAGTFNCCGLCVQIAAMQL